MRILFNGTDGGIVDMDHPIGDRGNGAVMGNDQHRIAVFPTGVLQKLQHLFACFKIQRTGWFIA